jgi:hypothetical protein
MSDEAKLFSPPSKNVTQDTKVLTKAFGGARYMLDNSTEFSLKEREC